MIGATLRSSAREGFPTAGRGVVMVSDDREGAWYATLEELRSVLAEAPELEGLIEVAGQAMASYDPEREAVVIESGPDVVSVYLVREAEVITLGSLAFVTPT